MIDTRSLKWRLSWRLFAANVALVATLAAIISVVGWMNGLLVDVQGGRAARLIENSVQVTRGGELVLKPTDELISWKRAHPSQWFVVRGKQGQAAQFGEVPDAAKALSRSLEVNQGVREATYWREKDNQPFARLIPIATSHGQAVALISVGDALTLGEVLGEIIPLAIAAATPVVLLLSLIFAVVVGVSIRSALRPLRDVVHEADEIDMDRKNMRLRESGSPTEISPVIKAFNRALARLDKGYAAWARFMADAAHEIRTPVAVLQARIDSLDPSSEQKVLKRDVERLAKICEQLLDLQQLSQKPLLRSAVDLSEVAREAAADFAPMMIAVGRNLSVQTDGGHQVAGDRDEISRALANLLTNALRHGQGAVTIHVMGHSIAVEDEGTGVPPHARLDVLEPFHRIDTRKAGAGLGLAIIQEIMRRHDGGVSIGAAPGGGARVTLAFAGMVSVD